MRLCKGAYLEPPRSLFRERPTWTAIIVELMKILLDKGVYPAIATHDPKMIEATKAYVIGARRSPRDRFEFQMLYGIRRDLQRSWWPKATGCGSTFPSVRPGIPTTCAVWRNVRPTSSSCCGICCGIRRAPLREPQRWYQKLSG